MKHRTALITAGSIAAVVFAAAIAVGANLGILTVADSRPVGTLSAATVAPPSPTAQPTPDSATTAAVSQKYVIRKAGTLAVRFSDSAVRLTDVTPKRHWNWELKQTGDRKLTVTFRRASALYRFVAVVDRHGKLSASVVHPVTRVAASGSSASPTSASATPATPAPSSSAQGEGSGDDEHSHDGHYGEEGGEDDD